MRYWLEKNLKKRSAKPKNRIHYGFFFKYQGGIFAFILPSNQRFGLITLSVSGTVTETKTGTGTETWIAWVVWFHVGPFILHLSRDRGQHLLSAIVLVPVPVPVPVPDTASVITPLQGI